MVYIVYTAANQGLKCLQIIYKSFTHCFKWFTRASGEGPLRSVNRHLRVGRCPKAAQRARMEEGSRVFSAGGLMQAAAAGLRHSRAPIFNDPFWAFVACLLFQFDFCAYSSIFVKYGW